MLGSVAVNPVFPSSGQFVGGNLPIDHVHAVVVRPSDPTPPLKDIVVPFNLNADQLQLKLQSLQLENPAESLDVTIELLSGSTVLFSGTQRLEATAGPTPSPAPPLPLTFVGPGASLTAVFLAPLDSTLTRGDNLPMRVSGEDANQLPVTSFYVSWSTSDTNVARVNGDGVVTGKAPRGVVYVRAQTPSTVTVPAGVVESTTVTLVPVPTALQKVSGDLQSAGPGQALPLPLVVRVIATDQLGVSGVTVTFTPPPGGSVLPTSAVTDVNGLAQTTATMPATGSTRVNFTAATAGLASVSFGEDFAAAPTPTWIGTVSFDWFDPANWSTGAVPTATDDVVIPAGTPNDPEIDNSTAVHSLTIQSGATLTTDDISLTVNGSLDASGSFVGCCSDDISLAGTGTLRGNFDQLLLDILPGAVMTLNGSVLATNTDVQVEGQLILAGHTMDLGVESFSTTNGTGLLTMTNAADLLVAGPTTFAGGDETGKLTAGLVNVSGSFDQFGTPLSFAASGTHTVQSTGSGLQTITFANPATSHFQNIVVGNTTGGSTLGSDFTVAGIAGFSNGTVPRIVHGNGHTLTMLNLRMDLITLDNLLVVGGPAITQFDRVTFSNTSATATAVTIVNPGTVTPFTFTDLVFQVTPTSGKYMSVTDNAADANVLTIDLVNPTPGTPGGFLSVAGGAVVNWPAAPAGVRTWVGTTSGDWSTPANWGPALVPTVNDSVVIVAATNAATLSAASNFAAAVNITGGSLNLNGRTLSVGRGFVTSGGGNLVMTSAAATLNVVGDATFDGANELGSMSAGTTTIGGNLTQLASNSPDSYHPSGTHLTVFNGVNQTVSFATPGLVPGSSHLQEVVWSGAGTLTLASAVNAHGTFTILTSNATTIAGANQLLTVGGFNSSANPTVFNGVQLLISQATPTTLNVSNLSFINQSSTVIQLQVSHPGAAAPATFSNLTFSSVPTTGFYLSAIDLNPGNGLPFTIDMVNPNPATPGSFVQTVSGAVVNWPAGGGAPIIWTGAVSTDWSNPGNWSNNAVPTVSDSVEIPAGGNQPSLTTTSLVGAVHLANGTLTLNGQVLGVTRTFATSGSGRLVMTNPSDGLSIVGNAIFDGANEFGFMSEGAISIGGNLTQLATNSPDSYHPSSNHLTSFVGTNPTITFATPGLVPGSSHFQQVFWNGTGTLTLGSAVFAHGDWIVATAAPTTIQGTGTLVVGGFFSAAQPLTFDGEALQIIDTGTGTIALNDISFANQNPAGVQLSILHPGFGTITTSNLSFTTVPTAGFYLRAEDTAPADGQILTLDMVNPNPATPGSFVQTVGGAVVNWPAAGGGGNGTWTGLVSGDWNDPGNWQGNQVPGAGADILIVAGAPNYPGLISSETVNDLFIDPAAQITNIDGTLDVGGNLTGGGTFVGGGLTLSGAGKTLDLANAGDIQITGQITLLNSLDLTSGGITIFGPGASFDVNGNGVTTTGDLQTANGGVLIMTVSGAQVEVGGTTIFDGGDESGLLSAGLLLVEGDFIQTNTSSDSSFVATGTFHVTLASAAATQTITMSDSTTSFFQDLQFGGPSNVVAGSIIFVRGNLDVASAVEVSSNDITFTGGGFNVLGNVTTAGGNLLQTGRLYVGGVLSFNGTWNQTSVIFTGTGQTAPSNLPYQFFYSTGTVTLAPGNASMGTLTTQGGTLTLGGRTTVNDVFLESGTLKPNSHTLVVVGALQTLSTGTLTMQNPLDSVLVTGLGAFGGGSTVGLMTDGVLKIGGSFAQTSGTSPTSFAPSGTHKTILGAAAVKVVNFASPGTGAGGSHFANLDVSSATGGLTLLNNIVADGALIAQPTAALPALITGGGKTVTAMALTVSTGFTTSLVLDNAPLIVNEQGTIRAQQFDRAAFQGFPTGANSVTLLDVTAVGAAVQRQVTFNTTTLQTSLGTGGFYVRVTSSNGLGLKLIMNGSNDPTGGFSRSQTANGAVIQYQ